MLYKYLLLLFLEILKMDASYFQVDLGRLIVRHYMPTCNTMKNNIQKMMLFKIIHIEIFAFV